MKKIFCLFILFGFILFACGCTPSSQKDEEDTNTDTSDITDTLDEFEGTVDPEKAETNTQLYNFVIDRLRANDFEPLYEYAGDDFSALMDKENFIYIFESISRIVCLSNKSNFYISTLN